MYINNIQIMAVTKSLSKFIFTSHENRLFIRMYVTLLDPKLFIEKKTLKYKRYKQLLMNHTNMSDREVKIVLKHKKIFEIPQIQIIRNCKTCKNLGVSLYATGSNIEFLQLDQEELENRISILKEMGARYINTAMIKSLASTVPMASFKVHSGIPDNVNVAEILYSHLHKPPPKVPPLQDMSEHLTVYHYRQKCLKHYLQWRFELSDVNERLLNNRATKLRNITFSSIKYAFDVMHNDGEMPIQTIWNYQCLVECSGPDLKQIFDNCQSICGRSIIELLKISPQLHKMKYKNVPIIKKYLEQNNITGEQVENSPQILLLDEDYFVKSWQRVMETPRLRILLGHPYVLRIFTLKDNFNHRIDYLEHLGILDATVQILSKTPANFERSIKCGSRRQRADEISLILGRHLNLNVNYIERILSKHPFWRHVNLFNIYNTLNYLKVHFDNADIEKNLHIILYSKDKVKGVLETLIHNNGLMDESNRYTPSQILALCVYEMEKAFHFSGDGIWEKSHQINLPSATE